MGIFDGLGELFDEHVLKPVSGAWNEGTQLVAEGVATMLPAGKVKFDMIPGIDISYDPRGIASDLIHTAGDILNPVESVANLADSVANYVDTFGGDLGQWVKETYSSPENFFKNSYQIKKAQEDVMGNALMTLTGLLPSTAVTKAVTRPAVKAAKAELKTAKAAMKAGNADKTAVKAAKHDYSQKKRIARVANTAARVSKHPARKAIRGYTADERDRFALNQEFGRGFYNDYRTRIEQRGVNEWNKKKQNVSQKT